MCSLNFQKIHHFGKEGEEAILKVISGERIGKDEALYLYKELDFLSLGLLAHLVRKRKAGDKEVSFVIDRNINYTNVCESRCKFCAFWKRKEDSRAYVLTKEKIAKKIEEAISLGATSILIQGGLNPDLDLSYIVDLFKFIKKNYEIAIHGLSPPEIYYYSKKDGVSVESTLILLKEAGLFSIPGGGAEILSDRVRNVISPKKCSKDIWLYVMEKAHRLGIRSTATMMFGHVETLEERIDHLLLIRDLQDRTGGFTAFIPWTFQPKNTKLSYIRKLGADAYLRMVAISRIVLDNFFNIQASWVTQGMKIAQIALNFGANDLGSLMIEENVVKATGVTFRTTVSEMVRVIKDAGYVPVQRDSVYRKLRYF